MNRSYCKLIAMAVILLLISGCATSGTAPDSESSSTDGTRTKVEGTAIGAGVGALLGAGVALATGHKDDALKYAAIGAAAGGVLGYIAGHRVAQIKAQYATEEERLDGEIKLAAQLNQEIRDSNTATANQINSLNQEISNLASGNCSRKDQIDKLAKNKKETNDLVKKNEGTISDIKTEVDALVAYKQGVEQTQNHQQVEKLELEISTLQTEIAMLDKSNLQMAKMVESLNVRK